MFLYLLIFVAKVIEVSMMTIRIVLITKGERKIGATIAFFEVTLWIFLASSVLNGIAQDPLKAVFYALGFAVGNYSGSLLEEKLGIGLSKVQVIVKEEHGQLLAEHLRLHDFAVTLVKGEGKNFARYILFMYVKRKRVTLVHQLIVDKNPNAVITISDSKPIYGGYGLRK